MPPCWSCWCRKCYLACERVCVWVCTHHGPVWWWQRRSFCRFRASGAGFLSWPLSPAAALPPDGTRRGNNCRRPENAARRRKEKRHSSETEFGRSLKSGAPDLTGRVCLRCRVAKSELYSQSVDFSIRQRTDATNQPIPHEIKKTESIKSI